jgi:thioredoxin-related protein
MRILLFIFSITLAVQLSAQEKTEWLSDMQTAKKEAATSQKNILISFSGSDWCGNCIRLDKEFFQSAEFQNYSNEHLILLKLDFPAKKANKLSASQTEHNDKWAEVYNKNGSFPLTILIDKDGKQLGVMKFPLTTVAAYIGSLKSINK